MVKKMPLPILSIYLFIQRKAVIRSGAWQSPPPSLHYQTPWGELIFSAPPYIHCCSPVEETGRGVHLQTPSTELTPEWRLEEQTEQKERGGGGTSMRSIALHMSGHLAGRNSFELYFNFPTLWCQISRRFSGKAQVVKKKKKKTTDN